MEFVKTTLAGLAVGIGGVAMAAEGTFENHLTSSTIVSPAQIYQIEKAKTDFHLGYSAYEDSIKPKGTDELKAKATGTNLFASGIYNVQGLDLRAGLSVSYTTASGKSEGIVNANKAEFKADATEMVLTPQAAYTAGPIVFGAAFDIVQRTEKIEDLDEAKSSHVTFRPGALYKNQEMEVGLTYRAPNRKTPAPEKTKELQVAEAAEVIAHGRYALTREFAAGVILGTINHKAIDEDRYKDRTVIRGTAEYRIGETKLEGDLGYNTAYYKNDAAMAQDSIGTYQLGAAADYALSKAATVGGGIGYEFGSDSNDNVKVANNNLTIAVRGNMAF